MKLSQICKQVVQYSIDHDYLLECGSLSNVYRAEYGYNGVSPKACMDYLQGLPTVCTVPFYNSEILEMFKQHDIERKTEEGKDYLIEVYWIECGKAFYNLIK